jgi:hypothetical protein
MGQPTAKSDLLKTRSFGEPNCCTHGTQSKTAVVDRAFDAVRSRLQVRARSNNSTLPGPTAELGGQVARFAALRSARLESQNLVVCMQCAPPARFTANERAQWSPRRYGNLARPLARRIADDWMLSTVLFHFVTSEPDVPGRAGAFTGTGGRGPGLAPFNFQENMLCIADGSGPGTSVGTPTWISVARAHRCRCLLRSLGMRGSII